MANIFTASIDAAIVPPWGSVYVNGGNTIAVDSSSQLFGTGSMKGTFNGAGYYCMATKTGINPTGNTTIWFHTLVKFPGALAHAGDINLFDMNSGGALVYYVKVFLQEGTGGDADAWRIKYEVYDFVAPFTNYLRDTLNSAYYDPSAGLWAVCKYTTGAGTGAAELYVTVGTAAESITPDDTAAGLTITALGDTTCDVNCGNQLSSGPTAGSIYWDEFHLDTAHLDNPLYVPPPAAGYDPEFYLLHRKYLDSNGVLLQDITNF